MLPLILNPANIRVLVIGNGPATAKRLEMLDAAGADYKHLSQWDKVTQLTAWKQSSNRVATELSLPPLRGEVRRGGKTLAVGSNTETPNQIPPPPRPSPSGGEGVDSARSSSILFVADFDDATSAEIYHAAKVQGYLVNVEDKKDYCDFHVPAMVRRGELLFTISTGGASPRLARRLRHMLETLFPPAWSDWLETIKQNRNQWKAEGASFSELAEKTDALLDENGWLKQDCACLRGWIPLPMGEVAERSDAGEGFSSMHFEVENEGDTAYPHPKSATQISTSPSGRGNS